MTTTLNDRRIIGEPYRSSPRGTTAGVSLLQRPRRGGPLPGKRVRVRPKTTGWVVGDNLGFALSTDTACVVQRLTLPGLALVIKAVVCSRKSADSFRRTRERGNGAATRCLCRHLQRKLRKPDLGAKPTLSVSALCRQSMRLSLKRNRQGKMSW